MRLSDAEGVQIDVELEARHLDPIWRILADLEQGTQDQWSGDADRTLRGLERTAAEFMDQVLCGDHRMRERLAWLGRAADAEGRTLRLILEFEDDALSLIPWELVAGASKGSSPLSGARVLRRMASEHHVWASTGGWLEIYCTGPVSGGGDLTDPGGLGEGLADLDRTHVVPEGRRSPEPRIQGRPYRVHHCRMLGEGLVSLDEERCPPDEVGLTVVELLASGEDTPGLSPRLAWSLGAGGPVICARGPMLGGVGGVAWDSLYRALAGGLSLENAVEAVRDGLRLLGHAHPDARWWSPMLLIPAGDLDRVPIPVSEGLRLHGAPIGSPEGEAVLARARSLGRPVGYMGLEHLVRALLEHESSAPLILAARPGLSLFLERHEAVTGSPGEPRPTPRFQALISDLSGGFGPLELLVELVLVPWVARSLDPFVVDRLQSLAERTEDSIELSALGERDAHRRRFLLEGGPEDGRVIPLRRPGLVIGRWDPGQPDLREGKLFIDSSCVDRTVSRKALTWHGGDCVELGGELRLERTGSASRAVSGRFQVQPGDRIWLGTRTCLRLLD